MVTKPTVEARFNEVDCHILQDVLSLDGEVVLSRQLVDCSQFLCFLLLRHVPDAPGLSIQSLLPMQDERA